MTEMFLTKEFDFSAVASLEFTREDKILQGHNYEFCITVKGVPDKTGIIIHTTELKRIVNETILSKLDNRNLNEIIFNPTMENVAIWIWEQLVKMIPGLYEIRVWENRKKGNSAIYRG